MLEHEEAAPGAQHASDLRERAGGQWAEVEAVTFATQTNSFLLLDANTRPLTPIILWPDRRAADLEAEIRDRAALDARDPETPRRAAGRAGALVG